MYTKAHKCHFGIQQNLAMKSSCTADEVVYSSSRQQLLKTRNSELQFFYCAFEAMVFYFLKQSFLCPFLWLLRCCCCCLACPIRGASECVVYTWQEHWRKESQCKKLLSTFSSRGMCRMPSGLPGCPHITLLTAVIICDRPQKRCRKGCQNEMFFFLVLVHPTE